MARGDLMLGPGGAMKRVRSESVQIDNILALLHQALEKLDEKDIRGGGERVVDAIYLAAKLQKQVARGYHANPGVYAPFTVKGVIGTDVHSIAYQHAKDGKLYKHDFQRGSAEVLAVSRHGKRDLLVTGVDGIPLWDEF